jgi:hypothetical protein
MKISILQLILLFVICVTLPFLFNVKYSENMAIYPSKTDIVRLSDSSCTDLSCTDISFVETMSNGTKLSTSYSRYEKEPEKTKKKESNSILDFFKGFFTIESYENREFENTNHGNKYEKLEDKKKFINDKGTLVKMNIDSTKYNELFNDAEYKLKNIQNNYELYKATNPGKKITVTTTATATATPAGLPPAANPTTAPDSGAPAVDSTTGSTGASILPPAPDTPSLPTGASTSTISGVTLGENEYTQYDKFIDEDLIKMPGMSASEYLRNRNNVNSESGNPTVKKTDDDFINQIEGQLSIIKFFRDILYSVNKESFSLFKDSFSLFKETFTSYIEPYDNHNLKDLKDDTTYTLENKEKLVYNKGVLTEGRVDNTQYGDVLAKLNSDIITINNQYDKFLNDNGTSSTGSSGTGTGTASSSTDRSTGSTTTSTTNSPQGVSSRNTAVGSNYQDSYDASCNTMNIKCVADFGTEIGDELCCGQEGELESTKYVCPNTMPTCSNYKCGSHFGTCS